jgi:hypothetical protein
MGDMSTQTTSACVDVLLENDSERISDRPILVCHSQTILVTVHDTRCSTMRLPTNLNVEVRIDSGTGAFTST